MHRNVLRASALAILYLTASALTYGLHPNLGLANERYGVVPMVSGEAYEPFVRRALVPALVRVTHALLPQGVVDRINAAVDRRAGSSEIDPDYQKSKRALIDGMTGHWSVAAVSAFFIVLSLAGALFVLRRLLVVLFDPPPLAADLFPLVLILMLPAFMGYSVFIYDYPVLLLFAAALLFIAQKRWRPYYVVYVLALLNKETGVLLPLVFAVTQYDSMPRRDLARHLAAQIAIAALVLGGLWWMFHDNAGAVTEFHLRRNLAWLADPRNYAVFIELGPSPLAPRGLPVRVPVGLNLPFIALVVALVAAGWRSAPPLLRRSLPAILLPILPLQLLLGFVDETRVWYEALPVVVALLYVSASTRLGTRPRG